MRLTRRVGGLSGRAWRDEGGQTAFLYVLLLITVLMFFALSVDAGLWYFDQRTAQSQVDAAVAASILELPAEADDLDDVTAVLIEWLEHNGTDATVLSDCPAGGAPPGVPQLVGNVEYYDQDDDDLYDTVRACLRRESPSLFANFFTLPGVHVSASAIGRVTTTSIPLDSVMVLDATGSMQGQPLAQAKAAATEFINILLPSAAGSQDTQVGFAPFRGCYNPPNSYVFQGIERCVTLSTMSSPLVGFSGKQQMLNKIQAIDAPGGSGTNVCLGLLKAKEFLDASSQAGEPGLIRHIVLLSDGDNNYNAVSYPPAPECSPDDAQNSDQFVDSACRSAQPRERDLDDLTWDLVQDLEADGVEIWVVGFGVCGSQNNNLCSVAAIGGTGHDNTADRNLLKCIASSTPGTNDHYFEATASQLVQVFQSIARQIVAERALVQ